LGLTEKVQRGQDTIKKDSMNTMAEAMQAMNDPAVMAEAMKMMKDPQFAQQMQAMQSDPTMKKYMAAVSTYFLSYFKIKSHE
jgi:cytochrome c1